MDHIGVCFFLSTKTRQYTSSCTPLATLQRAIKPRPHTTLSVKHHSPSPTLSSYLHFFWKVILYFFLIRSGLLKSLHTIAPSWKLHPCDDSPSSLYDLPLSVFIPYSCTPSCTLLSAFYSTLPLPCVCVFFLTPSPSRHFAHRQNLFFFLRHLFGGVTYFFSHP